MYHPSKAIYPTTEINSALQQSLENICSRNDDSLILCGDFNQLPTSLITNMGLLEVFVGPTHAGHNLDRIYATENVYTVCRAIESSVNTKHRAVVAHTEPIKNSGKITTTHKFRQQTPGQHAALLQHLSNFSWQSLYNCISPEEMFNEFYEICSEILETLYPTKTVSTTNWDPYFLTPNIKALLRKLNKLMCRNKVEAANAITARIGRMITKTNSTTFRT